MKAAGSLLTRVATIGSYEKYADAQTAIERLAGVGPASCFSILARDVRTVVQPKQGLVNRVLRGAFVGGVIGGIVGAFVLWMWEVESGSAINVVFLASGCGSAIGAVIRAVTRPPDSFNIEAKSYDVVCDIDRADSARAMLYRRAG